MSAAGLLGSLLGGVGGRTLGSAIGGRNGAMVGSLLGSMLGGRGARGARRGGGGGLGGLGSMLGGLGGGGDDGDDAANAPTVTDSDAEVLIRSMCNAAKSDGQVDQAELDGIIGRVGDADESDVAFLRAELQSPFVEAGDFARAVPDHLRRDTYVVALSAIDVDTDAESKYLASLAGALGFDDNEVERIHAELAG